MTTNPAPPHDDAADADALRAICGLYADVSLLALGLYFQAGHAIYQGEPSDSKRAARENALSVSSLMDTAVEGLRTVWAQHAGAPSISVRERLAEWGHADGATPRRERALRARVAADVLARLDGRMVGPRLPSIPAAELNTVPTPSIHRGPRGTFQGPYPVVTVTILGLDPTAPAGDSYDGAVIARYAAPDAAPDSFELVFRDGANPDTAIDDAMLATWGIIQRDGRVWEPAAA